jgi:outer membrane biosynthesis protein TonB
MDGGDTVRSEVSGDEKLLREEIERSESVLEGLEQDLRALNAQLDEAAGKRHEFELVSSICRSLSELEELGAADLFWGEDGAPDKTQSRLHEVRERADAFESGIKEIEDRRASIMHSVDDVNAALDVLHYELTDAIELDESRKSEWIVEREESEVPYRAQIMPWMRGLEEDQRFHRALAASIVACIVLGWLVSVTVLPIPERAEILEVPERVAKLVRQEREPPPPPEPVEEPVLPEETPPEPEPVLAEEQPPELQPEVAEEPAIAKAEPPKPEEKVQSKGILAFRESFAARANSKPVADLGSNARVTNAGDTAVGRPQRSMVTTSAPGSSGGINLADISRDVGGAGPGMGGVAVSRVASSIGGADGPDRPLSSGRSAGRTDEEIQIVFDRYKAALYRLYNRELRKDPTLRGQIILRLTIQPDGSVSFCQLQSSDMNAPVLADQIVDRVSQFDFGAKDGIVAMTIIYPIDFLPTA